MPIYNESSNPFLLEWGESAPGARISGAEKFGAQHELPNPATGRTFANVSWVGIDAVDEAVRSATKAAPGWAHTSPRERASMLRAIAQTLRENTEHLGAIVSAETGKRLAEAEGEVAFSSMYFDWFADAATMDRDEYYVTGLRRFLVQRRPVGVVAAVSPWNFPLSIPARKIAPALAAGCPIVQKASEIAPLSSIALTELCERHLPEGVISLLVGDGEKLTNALVDHEGIDAVSFTGSTRVGSLVAQRAMRSMTRVTMELGGKAPYIVCNDADTEVALEALMVAKFRNNGASCLAANNVFIHENLYKDFVKQLKERVSTLRTGNPADAATELGPLIREDHVVRLNKLVESTKQNGNQVWQAELPDQKGWFMAPTVVESTTDDDLWNEEVFGPVCTVRSFTDESAVVEEVNSWRTGLGGYVMSTNLEHQMRLASDLRVGIVGINNGAPNTPEVPFGGIGKAGIGREGGISGVREFSEEQTISIAR